MSDKLRKLADEIAADIGGKGQGEGSLVSSSPARVTRRSTIVDREPSKVNGFHTTHDPAVGETTGVQGSAVRVLPDGRRVLADVVDHRGAPVPGAGAYMVTAEGVFGGRVMPVRLTAEGEWSTRGYDAGHFDTERDAVDAAAAAVEGVIRQAERWEQLGRRVMAERCRSLVGSVKVVAAD